MSRSVSDLKTDIDRIQRQLPEAGYIFTKEEVRNLVKYCGGWVELWEAMRGKDENSSRS